MITTSASPNDQVMKGIILISVSVFAMAFADGLVKLISADLTIWQLFVVRALFSTPCLFLIASVQKASLTPVSFYWIGLRSLLLVLCWLLYYAALPFLNLAIAAVVAYTNPIITTLLSAMVLRERVSRRQWIGVCLGFCGVLIILQPGGDQFSLYMLMPLLAACFYSAAMVLTRSTCKDENAITLALGLNGTFILAGLAVTGLIALDLFDQTLTENQPFLLGDWAIMGIREWAILAVLGALSAGYFLGVARAYQIAPPQIIATFDYGYLISAAIWGFVLFSEGLTLSTILGMSLITCAGATAAKK